MKGIVGMKFVRVLQGKLIVVVLVSMAVVGGATAFAATAAGQGLVHAIAGQAHAPATPDGKSHGNTLQASTTHHADKSTKNTCPGLPDPQHLPVQFALGTASTSDDIQSVSTLHKGTFTGATPKGAAVASNRGFTSGE